MAPEVEEAMPSGGRYLRLIGLGALIGVPAGLLAALFLAAVHGLEGLVFGDSPDWYLLLVMPVVGAAIVAAARWLLPGDGGHSPIEGLGATPTPVSHFPGVAIAALGTLAFGAVLGPEAPLIALGSVVGMAAASLARLDERGSAVLSTAGSFSAVSAIFGGPLVAGILLLEAGVALGGAVIPLLLPGLVAAACGYAIFVGLGNWGGIQTQTLSVPDLPRYDGTSVEDLLVAVALGVLTAVAVELVRTLARRIEGHRAAGSSRRDPRMPAVLLAGGFGVGLLAVISDLLGADPTDVLFSGQSAVPDLVVEGSAGILLVLLVAKSLGYAISLGCGFRGGPVFPAIFMGIGIAALLSLALDLSPTVVVAIGTAAGMAAASGLLFSGVLFALLLTGGAGVDAVPAASLAAASAWIVRSAIERRLAVE